MFLLNVLNVSGILYPRTPDPTFENVGLEHGLSQITVNCITRDRNGFMWFGTQDGLNRYDGYNFTIYRHNPDNPSSLSDNHIRVILEDIDEPVLWIGTNNGGLCKFDPDVDRFTNYRYLPNDPNSLSYDEVYFLYQEKNGILWVGTWGGGLNKFDKKNGTFTRYRYNRDNPSGLSHDIVRTIFEDSKGVMWIGSYGGGLNKFNRETGEFSHYRYDPADPGSLGNDQVMSICECRDGGLWIGTDGGGINRFDPAAGTFTRYRHNPTDPGSLANDRVRDIHEDRSGRLWVATYGGGLNRFDQETRTFTEYRHDPGQLKSLPHDQVLSLYEDNNDLLWIGTQSGGVAKLDLREKKFNLYSYLPGKPGSLSAGEVRAFTEDPGGILWIGTNGGGLNKFDRKKNKYTVFRHEPGNPDSLSFDRVYALCPDKDRNVLWVGTFGGGLNKFDKKKGRFTRYSSNPDPRNRSRISHDRIRTILEDRTGTLWIGTWDGGLNRFHKETETFDHYRHDPGKPDTIGHDKIFCLYEDRSGVLWVGTWGGGLCRYNRETDNFTRFRYKPGNPNALISDRILCIYEDSSGVFWIGSGDRGLNKFDREQNLWSAYTARNGLPNDVIYGILEDETGHLWLSSNGGISKFNPKTGTVKNYGAGDGLQGNEFNGGAYYKSSSGEMFFGGINGFNSFFPSEIEDNPFIPPVLITGFRKFNEPVKFDKSTWKVKEIVLSYKDNFISFEFVALNYRVPGDNRYAYKMDGFDKDWIYCGDRQTAVYTNLAGGNYVFRVRGSNNDGLWNNEGASVKLVVIPPFWKRLWFQVFAIFVLLGLGYLAYRIRTYGILDRNKQLVKINDRLNREIAERRKVEEALRVSEEKYRAIFENSIDVHFCVDVKGKLRIISPSGAKLLGYNNTREMLDKDVAATFYYNPGDRENFVEAIGKYGKITNYEIVLKKKDGTPVEVESNARLVYGEDHTPAAIEGIFREITGRKQAEKENLRLQEQLLSAKKMESVGTLAGGMAHEFNNLMATIIGNAVMLQGFMIEDVLMRKRVQSILDSANRSAALTDQLLSFSRKQFLQLRKLDINDLLKGMEDSIRRTAGGGIDVVFLPAPWLEPIEVDSKMMIQVVMGIVQNAVDAMSGGGRLTVKTLMKEVDDLKNELPYEPRGKMVALSVEDTGVGMDKEIIQHIFDPFFTTKEVGKGLGLDLSVVYGTVRQHNGWIDVDSAPGKGTTMTIYLPVLSEKK